MYVYVPKSLLVERTRRVRLRYEASSGGSKNKFVCSLAICCLHTTMYVDCILWVVSRVSLPIVIHAQARGIKEYRH